MNVTLSRFVRTRQTVMIVYIDRYQNVTQRYVRVLQVHDDYILAYCFYRRQVRQFKTANILSCGSTRAGVV